MTTKKKTATRKRRDHAAKRSPIGVRRLKLSLPPEVEKEFEKAGYHLCWVGERYLSEFKRALYTHVTEEELNVAYGESDGVIGAGDAAEADAKPGSNVSRYTGRDDRGNEENSYLMKLPLEYWREDQEALEAQNAEVDDALTGLNKNMDNPSRTYRRREHGISVRDRH